MNRRPDGLLDARGSGSTQDPDAGAAPSQALETQPGVPIGPGGPDGPGGAEIIQPRLGPIGWLRWIWRQLTSMRTALLLLMLLAVAAIPGSVFPQNRIDPARVDSYLTAHPSAGPLLQRLGAFTVYSSPWFSAIYLLLFISLVGCVLPRAAQHWRAVRAQPPRVPRRLERMPAFAQASTDATPAQVAQAARAVLRSGRYRIAAAAAPDQTDRTPDRVEVAAERGYLAETGNLLFHLALLALLFTIAAGSFVSYSGQSVVVVGKTWSNDLLNYDSFTPGRAVNSDDLPPFSFTLRSLEVKFDSRATGNQFGAPRDFKAAVDFQASPGAPVRSQTIQVNHPLKVDGASAFLVGNGYAPVITVRDPAGQVVARSRNPFQPIDGNYTSTGVAKVPDGLSTQLGLIGTLLPTAARNPQTGQPVSVFPDAGNPMLIFTAFTGNLGIDDGTPQSVYALDVSRMKQLTDGDQPFSAALQLGQTVKLPGNLGTVTFESLPRYAALDVRHDPTKVWVLLSAIAALLGLTISLFVHRRRVWVRALPDQQGRTVVQVGGLARSEDAGLMAEVTDLLDALTLTPMKPGR